MKNALLTTTLTTFAQKTDTWQIVADDIDPIIITA